MELTLHPADPQLAIQRFDTRSVTVNGVQFSHGVLLSHAAPPTAWECPSVSRLEIEHLPPLLASQPRIILFGCGAKQEFIRPEVLVWLNQQGIGCECMTTAAACRTFNTLLDEGRHVVAALKLGDTDPELVTSDPISSSLPGNSKTG